MTPPSPAPSPRTRGGGTCVVGDLGGTRVRMATVDPSTGELENIEVLTRVEHDSVQDAVQSYLDHAAVDHLAEICLAVAGPVDGDLVVLPNTDWYFRCSELQEALGTPLTVINDFTAQALAVERLREDELRWLGAPRPSPTKRGIEVVIGPGTGLGAAVRTTSGEIIPSEAGHVGFAPTNDEQIRILEALLGIYRRVSIERVASGPGLENLYWAKTKLAGVDATARPPLRSASEISRLASEGDRLARETVDLFFDILAAYAGDMALANWATGGIYLSGGVMTKLAPFFDGDDFRSRFENKGRFSDFCRSVPVAIVEAEHPGLIGCCAALAHAPDRARSRSTA